MKYYAYAGKWHCRITDGGELGSGVTLDAAIADAQRKDDAALIARLRWQIYTLWTTLCAVVWMVCIFATL